LTRLSDYISRANETIDEAEKLIGRNVYIDKSELELEEGEYYCLSDRLETYTEDGRYVGRVEAL
jgi:ribosomal 30S subunit maturation factor RimM